MNDGRFEMCGLLEASGFRVRGATRADCIHCEGHSRGTVAFTAEVAFCHRCKWTANVVKLSRELGHLKGNPEAASNFRAEAQLRASANGKINEFEAWRDTKIYHVSEKYRLLSKGAVRAGEVLAKFPDSEQAWDALARFYHVEV